MSDETNPPTIQVQHLNYKFPNGRPGLIDVSLDLPAGSRTLLIGANGAGKTTLLRLLSGQRLAPTGTISVRGLDPFSTHLSAVTYLGLEWVLNPVVRSDIDVPSLLASVGGDAYPTRRDELVEILDIDLRWRLHAVSDGERRRVQLAMGLIRPWKVLLLDEVTVDLDLLTRRRFLAFLKRETEGGNATLVYATHVLDGLADWPTHLVHMREGAVKRWGRTEEFHLLPDGAGTASLPDLALAWLWEDLNERGPRNQKAIIAADNKDNHHTSEFVHEGIGGYGYEPRKKIAS